MGEDIEHGANADDDKEHLDKPFHGLKFGTA